MHSNVKYPSRVEYSTTDFSLKFKKNADELSELLAKDAFNIASTGIFVKHDLREDKADSSEVDSESSSHDEDFGDGDDRFKGLLTIEAHSLTLDEIKLGLDNFEKNRNECYAFSHLCLTSLGIVDLKGTEDFGHLKSIDLSRNYLQSLAGLKALPYLTKFDASRNDLTEFPNFLAPISLFEVNVSRNLIEKLNDLSDFMALTDINISRNSLMEIDGLQNCPSLKVLNVSHNMISVVKNFICPNLIILIMNSNKLDNLDFLTNCDNLRHLNARKNIISKIGIVKNLIHLRELNLKYNNISDIMEISYLKHLKYLIHLSLSGNPLKKLGLWKQLTIHSVPQLLFFEGKRIEASERLAARNTFNPTLEEIAFRDHVNIMLDKTCQPATQKFEEYIHTRSLPPILLLVAPPWTNTHSVANFLKHHFRNKITFGTVHSTSTTVEHHLHFNVPISVEGFASMRMRGEFLATCQVLGKVCGFSVHQMLRAAEKGKVLVSTVPLGAAMSLKKWNLDISCILVVPAHTEDLTPFELKAQHEAMEKERERKGSGNYSKPGDSDHEKKNRSISFGKDVEDPKSNKRKGSILKSASQQQSEEHLGSASENETIGEYCEEMGEYEDKDGKMTEDETEGSKSEESTKNIKRSKKKRSKNKEHLKPLEQKGVHDLIDYILTRKKYPLAAFSCKEKNPSENYLVTFGTYGREPFGNANEIDYGEDAQNMTNFRKRVQHPRREKHKVCEKPTQLSDTSDSDAVSETTAHRFMNHEAQIQAIEKVKAHMIRFNNENPGFFSTSIYPDKLLNEGGPLLRIVKNLIKSQKAFTEDDMPAFEDLDDPDLIIFNDYKITSVKKATEYVPPFELFDFKICNKHNNIRY